MLELLKRAFLFRGIPEEILREEILPGGQIREYGREQCLIVPRQRVDEIGIVVSGRLHILHLFENGSQSLMNVLLPGDCLGADLVCTPSRISPYTVRAEQNAALFCLPAELLLGEGRMDASVREGCLRNLLELVARENMKKEYRLAILSQNGLRDRVRTYLTMQMRKRGQATFEIPFSREELASFLCVNRSALSHELGRMQAEGLIRFRKNRFTLNMQDAD